MASEADTLERWFSLADSNHDGRIEGTEAITFFQRSGLSRETLKEIWGRTAGTQPYMSKQQFYGAIRLVSLAQLSGGGFTPLQAQQMLTGTAPPPPLPKMTGLTPGTWTPPSTPPTYQHTGGSVQPPPVQYTGGSLTGAPTVQVTGQVPRQYTGGRQETFYPPLPLEEVTRYGQVFQSLDTDHDGFVQGAQCIELFSSRGVDRNILKQIWQVVVGNAGNINRDQFIKSLYLIETTKQGIPIPSTLPPGSFPPIVQGTGSMAAASSAYGQGNFPSLPNKAVFQPPDPAGYPGWRGPAANEGMVSTLDQAQRDRLLAEKYEAQKKDQQLYMMDQEAETARNKKEFYEKALQELMLFKSRMDVATMEVQEKLKREQDLTADAERRYEQIRYGAEEAAREAGTYTAALQEAQNRKTELETRLNEMQQDLAAREQAQPEMVHQMEMQIQALQESTTAIELRRNALTAELESYKHQHELFHRRQNDLQMAVAAAEAEVHSASGDIDRLASQVESLKESRDVELIQKLLRESARVYSNLHCHACKAGVEIPLEARLSLYGDDVTWSDDLIGAGVDISGWQEDGFVLVDAFPDVKEDMDTEFEKALQEAVKNIKTHETTKMPLPGATNFFSGGGGGFEGDPFQPTAVPAPVPASDFVSFDAFPSTDTQFPPPVVAAPSPAPAAAFATSREDHITESTAASAKDQSTSVAFAAFDDPPFISQPTETTSTVTFDTTFPDFTSAFPSTQETSSVPVVPNKDPAPDPFGGSAFP